MNEAETRAEHIDPALTAADRGEVEASAVRREFRITQPEQIRRVFVGFQNICTNADVLFSY